MAGSPRLDFDDRLVFTLARAASTATLTLPARLVLSAGEYESEFRATNDAFAQMLREQTADRVRIRVLVFDGETHASSIARAYVHGLKAAFAG